MDVCRYTMFIPLYPIGIGAEWWLMYLSIEHVGKISPALAYFFYFLLALYVPGKYLLYFYSAGCEHAQWETYMNS